MKDDPRSFLARPKRYDNIDGTAEIFIGLMLLGFAVACYWEARLPKDASRTMHAVAVYAALIPPLGLGYWLRKMVKRGITWPRTGYVAYGVGSKSRWNRMVTAWLIPAVLGAAVAFLYVWGMRHVPINFRRLSSLTVCVAVYALWVLRMGGYHLWKWLVLVFMALGLLAVELMSPRAGFRLSGQDMLFLGLVWLGSGGATLYSYLRHTQPPTLETP